MQKWLLAHLQVVELVGMEEIDGLRLLVEQNSFAHLTYCMNHP